MQPVQFTTRFIGEKRWSAPVLWRFGVAGKKQRFGSAAIKLQTGREILVDRNLPSEYSRRMKQGRRNNRLTMTG
jgi:hypothetical protein